MIELLSIILPGIPTTVVLEETFLVTTEFAPIFEFFPTFIGPKTLAPAPMITLSEIVGGLFFFYTFSSTQSNTLVNSYIIPNNRGFPDDYTHPMINK